MTTESLPFKDFFGNRNLKFRFCLGFVSRSLCIDCGVETRTLGASKAGFRMERIAKKHVFRVSRFGGDFGADMGPIVVVLGSLGDSFSDFCRCVFSVKPHPESGSCQADVGGSAPETNLFRLAKSSFRTE